ncbi:hypothetical protein E2C01_054043 [Portunus trituberculatus]|uniref:Uncharacterized protein n=1 Tax=Portunus trituberculatus TaxID=210409 RepID=A0A5B7GSN6_PORTR|nr:hypothetical protein [Portunus trituberculatus]
MYKCSEMTVAGSGEWWNSSHTVAGTRGRTASRCILRSRQCLESGRQKRAVSATFCPQEELGLELGLEISRVLSSSKN